MASDRRGVSRGQRPEQRWSWAGGRSLARANQNLRADTSNYWARSQDEIRLDKFAPGRGFRHLVTIEQLRAVIAMLPEWEEVAIGLDAITLGPGRSDIDGRYRTGYGVIELCAWPRRLWEPVPDWYGVEHRHLLDLFGVEYSYLPSAQWEIRWTAAQARAYQLLHILPHELGHHHDLITSRRQRTIGRGEAYAEDYANLVLEQVWPIYARTFSV